MAKSFHFPNILKSKSAVCSEVISITLLPSEQFKILRAAEVFIKTCTAARIQHRIQHQIIGCVLQTRGEGGHLKCLNKFHMPGPGKVTAVDNSKI